MKLTWFKPLDEGESQRLTVKKAKLHTALFITLAVLTVLSDFFQTLQTQGPGFSPLSDVVHGSPEGLGFYLLVMIVPAWVSAYALTELIAALFLKLPFNFLVPGQYVKANTIAYWLNVLLFVPIYLFGLSIYVSMFLMSFLLGIIGPPGLD